MLLAQRLSGSGCQTKCRRPDLPKMIEKRHPTWTRYRNRDISFWVSMFQREEPQPCNPQLCAE